MLICVQAAGEKSAAPNYPGRTLMVGYILERGADFSGSRRLNILEFGNIEDISSDESVLTTFRE
jgi:hypothetical protein